MLALNKGDIQDIANGNHNRYIDSQDKDELSRELASRLLQATPDKDDIENNLQNISDCLDDIDDVLLNNRTPKKVVIGVKQKIDDINRYIEEARDVLLSID